MTKELTIPLTQADVAGCIGSDHDDDSRLKNRLARQLLAAMQREQERQWQLIETAPSGIMVLLCIFPIYRCFVGLKNIHGEFASAVGVKNGYPIKLGPTHWMPLPEPPVNQHPTND